MSLLTWQIDALLNLNRLWLPPAVSAAAAVAGVVVTVAGRWCCRQRPWPAVAETVAVGAGVVAGRPAACTDGNAALEAVVSAHPAIIQNDKNDTTSIDITRSETKSESIESKKKVTKNAP